jgi:hypothetical protein
MQAGSEPEPVMSAAALDLGCVTDSLDVVAIGSYDESSVVVGAVLRPQTWRAVVSTPGLQRQAIELLNLFAGIGHESQVKGRVRGLFRRSPDA